MKSTRTGCCSTNHGASSELHEVELLTGLPGMTGHVQNSREEEQMALRSRSSNIYSFVRFVNRTLRKVDIIWLNYEGSRVKYKTLAQDQFVDVNTFVGHPWIFRDADTGDRLLVKLCEVYQPVGFASAEGCLPQRKVINITIPVFTLKDRCLQVVKQLVPRDQISQLDLPACLISDIRERTPYEISCSSSTVHCGSSSDED
ncbi:hypothetical protein ScPMuIL_010344 [Solemya velum]